MWSDISVTSSNKANYEDLCFRLTQTSTMYECGHRNKCTRKGDNWSRHNTKKRPVEPPVEPVGRLDKQADRTVTHSIDKEVTQTDSNVKLDIAALQREVIRAVQGPKAPDARLGKGVGHVEVCEGDLEPVSDEVLLRVCKKAEARDRSVVALVGKLLLFPKLYTMSSKLPTPVMDGLTLLMETQAAEVVSSTLLPLLHHWPPPLHHHHRDLLAHLLPSCSPLMATRMLRAYAERPHHHDTDLPTFHLLCESADAREPDTHTAALTALARMAPLHHTNVRFGQCLLMVVRRFGPHLQDLEGLRFVVNTHGSSLRKTVEMQMKKLEKMR